ncbi:MAG TPA: proton-conducting transporter membrane subunit, partial [Nitrospira sp.]|nr:proton-conducting transporter membrane subunit [Nitrospira sp.]
MSVLLIALLSCYAAGVVLPLCLPRRPVLQNRVAHSLAGAAGLLGVALGITSLIVPEPLTISLASTIPYLGFAVRVDALAAVFVLTISMIGVATSIYATGYVTEFYGRHSIGTLGSLLNGFLLAMTLVVIADNGFLFIMAWELMSLISYFLVVTEHEKADVRYAGFFYLVMTHVGTAFVVLTYLILFQSAGSFSFEAFRHTSQSLPEGMRALVFLAALVGFGTKAGIVPLHVWLPYAHPAAPSHISA